MNAATAAALTATLTAAGATDIHEVSTTRRTIVAFTAAGDSIFPIMDALLVASAADRHAAIFTHADTSTGRYHVQG